MHMYFSDTKVVVGMVRHTRTASTIISFLIPSTVYTHLCNNAVSYVTRHKADVHTYTEI